MEGERFPLAAVLVLASCTVTPLTNKIDVGEDAFVVGVGEGPDGMTDLFAAGAQGGPVYRLTFNRLEEHAPRLSSGGTQLVYLRDGGAGIDRPDPAIVVLNLLTNAERQTRLPPEARPALQVAWLAGDSAIVVASERGIWISAAPPGRLELARAMPGDSSRADSALRMPLGDPVVALRADCPSKEGLCVRSASGEIQVLDPDGSDVVPWGGDSVGYFARGEFSVRPLAGGRARHPTWTAAPSRLRQLTYHPGAMRP